jgi:hypothetical protein
MKEENNLKAKTEKRVIGRRELVALPDLGIDEIEAKIDTGAFTSAIHCSDIHEETDSQGRKVICIELLDPSHPQYNHKKLRFAEYDLREIKSSIGEKQQRYVIRTTIALFGEVMDAEFSLSDRSDMKYPVLIGRKLLKGKYVVDVSRRNISNKFNNKQNQKHN